MAKQLLSFNLTYLIFLLCILYSIERYSHCCVDIYSNFSALIPTPSFFPPSYRAAQIELLHALAAIAAENNLGQGILVKIKFNIVASLYDYNPNLAAFMKVGATVFINVTI